MKTKDVPRLTSCSFPGAPTSLHCPPAPAPPSTTRLSAIAPFQWGPLPWYCRCSPQSAPWASALHRLFSGGSVALPVPPPPPCRFYGRTDFQTMKLQTLCVLILSGGSMCSASVVWCVTIWSAASSGTECRLKPRAVGTSVTVHPAGASNICSLGSPPPPCRPSFLR